MAKPVTTTPARITAWSFSRWRDYEECPFKAKCKYVLKLKEPDNQYTARGSQIHKEAEDYAGGALKKLPASLASFKDEFAKLRKLSPQLEQQWAFTRSWQPTGWFDSNAWLRIKLDVNVMVKGRRYVIDHKTGKQREEHEDQLGLYALGAFLMHPMDDDLEVQDWYLDKKPDDPTKIVGADFTRDQLDDLKAEWERKTKIMLLDAKFTPKPNDKCRFCHYRKNNGGPCKF